jgi:DNA polymerase-3 subunit delta
VKKVLKVAEVNDTRTLTPVEAEGWLKRQMSIAGVTISDDAIKLFFSRVGKNLMIARNEADKLINYVKGKDKVTSKDVSDVVTKEVETEVFALTNAIIDKDKSKIISVYHDLTLSGKDAVQLMGLVSRNLIDIYNAKVLIDLKYNQSDVAKAMGISPGRAYYVMKNTKSFSTVDLEENIIKLHDLDYKIKTGQIDSTSGLEYFLFAV